MVLKRKNVYLTCGKLYIKSFDILWCNTCSLKYMQENLCTWNENEVIDDFIKEKQQKTRYPGIFLSGYLIIRLKYKNN